MTRLPLAPLASRRALLAHLAPPASTAIPAPPWDAAFRAELAHLAGVARRAIDAGYPSVIAAPWLVLAVERYVAEQERGNGA